MSDYTEMLNEFDRSEVEAGNRIFANGGVVRTVRGTSGRIYATVNSSFTDFSVSAIPENGRLNDVRCTCGRKDLCRHIAALLMHLSVSDELDEGIPVFSPGRHGFSTVCQGYCEACSHGPETGFSANRIIELNRISIQSDKMKNGVRTVWGLVGSHNLMDTNMRKVKIEIAADGFPEQVGCSCLASDADYFCEHIAALLIKLLPESLSPDIVSEPAVRKLMTISDGDFLPEDEKKTIAVIRYSAEGAYVLSLRDSFGSPIGAAEISDGNRNNLDEQGKRIASFIRSCGQGASSAVITSDNIDLLFHCIESGSCDINGVDAIITVGIPKISVTLSGIGHNGCQIAFGGEKVSIIGNGVKSYLLCGDTIVISPRLPQRTYSLIRALSEAGNCGLSISQRDLPAFFANVILPSRNWLDFTFADESLKSFVPPKLDCRVTLREEGDASLYASVMFVYGEEILYPYRANPSENRILWRDTDAEKRITAFFDHWFTAKSLVTGEYYIRSNDAAVFEFIKDGLPILRELAEVSLTESIGKASVRMPGHVMIKLGSDGSSVDLDLDLEGYSREELLQILKALKQEKHFVRLKDGSYAELDNESIQILRELAYGVGAAPEEFVSRMKLPMFRLLYLESMANLNSRIISERGKGYLAQLERGYKAKERISVEPKGISQPLRSYQKTGFLWMRSIEVYGFGGILADDMGLGKTVQTLALLQSDPPEGTEYSPSIVVCPTSLVDNWIQETKHFAPDLPAEAVRGSANERAAIIARAVHGRGLIITSYDSLKRDLPLYTNVFFRVIIADEAQTIKNRSTQAALALKSLSGRSRFALTGTPVENYPSELWSIFDFLMPRYLGTYNEFRRSSEQPILEGNTEAVDRLTHLISPFILRRVKRDVLTDLPDKSDILLKVTLGEDQKKVYTATAAALTGILEEHFGEEHLSPEDSITVLTLLLRLRQICCHPPLCVDENVCSSSAKLDTLLELVQNLLAENHRILIFSQFTSMLDCIAAELDRLKHGYFMLTGKTPPAERIEYVERFNQGEKGIFLISLKAGGTGLNLTGADTVIHYDPWWNAAAQNQATDRAHRIGQTHHVDVYRLIAENTVEEKICSLAERKSGIAEALLSDSMGSITSMTPGEIIDLLRYHRG